MIEDDLRALLAGFFEDTPVYARQIPMTLPECVVVQRIGGSPVNAGIRRARETISLMAVSTSRSLAMDLLRQARTALVTSMPYDSATTHYYTATALADGSLKKKSLSGPAYIEFTDLEVVASL